LKEQVEPKEWTIEDAVNTYGIRAWGAGYFDLSPKGEVIVRAGTGPDRPAVSMMDLLSGMRARGIATPVLLRVSNLLDSQISKLNESFQKAIQSLSYKGKYQGVFPIKVNQQAQVIEEITRFGARFNHGLEAGSKAELIIALSMIQSPESLIVCNGYKDEEFINLGLHAIKLGYKCFFVIETPSEVDLILRQSAALKVRPALGIRLKLSTRASGHWQDSGGDASLFGLTTNQMIEVLDRLKCENMLDCLQLLHYHLGSQIPNIRDIRTGVRETARFYAEMIKEGAPMGYIDLGGGLAVDYDGSQTNFEHSKNYTLDEYCTDIIEVVMDILNEEGLPHPTIITESGRALLAYSSILMFDVLDVNRFEAGPLPDALPPDSPELLKNLWLARQSITRKNIQECYNDAVYYREGCREQFKHGNLTLRQRALADNLFIDIIRRVGDLIDREKLVLPELDDLKDMQYDTYYGNFSVFQSLPDSWAIDQIFPVMPLHRHHEKPDRRAIFADITCDSDGKIDKFVDLHDVGKTLPVHSLRENEEYFIGVFLVGAYQETLGDLHNLLGDTNVVSIHINEDGSFDFVREMEGDSIWEVLSYVEYEPKNLIARFRSNAERAVKEGRISVEERRTILSDFEASIKGYTYFER
jgi:arginine decarboxylase